MENTVEVDQQIKHKTTYDSAILWKPGDTQIIHSQDRDTRKPK